LTKLDKLTL